MRSALALCLSASMATSAVPLGAQGATESVAAQRELLAQYAWAAIRKLAPGTGIVVTPRGAPAAGRCVVRAGESSLTVLNVNEQALPAPATRLLIEIASNHPEYLAAPTAGQFVDHDVRVGADGVFVGNRHVADLGQLVETIERSDVDEISIRRRGRGFWGRAGPLGGYFLGAMAGGFIAGFACRAAAGADRCDTGAFLIGAAVGGIAGGAQGFHAARAETEDVIYRAPRP